VSAALQQKLDAQSLPLDHRPVQRRHVLLVVAVGVRAGCDQVRDVEELGVAHQHCLLQLPLQRRDAPGLRVDARPTDRVQGAPNEGRQREDAQADDGSGPAPRHPGVWGHTRFTAG
jgi:hypothetical protein